MEHKPKVLIVATSSKTRGGITSVIKAHQKGSLWQTYQCKWIETHIDKNIFYKLIFLFEVLSNSFSLRLFTTLYISIPVNHLR